MGHSTTGAALIYPHDSDERQRFIADGVSDLARKALQNTPDPG